MTIRVAGLSRKLLLLVPDASYLSDEGDRQLNESTKEKTTLTREFPPEMIKKLGSLNNEMQFPGRKERLYEARGALNKQATVCQFCTWRFEMDTKLGNKAAATKPKASVASFGVPPVDPSIVGIKDSCKACIKFFAPALNNRENLTRRTPKQQQAHKTNTTKSNRKSKEKNSNAKRIAPDSDDEGSSKRQKVEEPVHSLSKAKLLSLIDPKTRCTMCGVQVKGHPRNRGHIDS